MNYVSLHDIPDQRGGGPFAFENEGPLAALDDRPRPGREPTITPEAKAWLVSLACPLIMPPACAQAMFPRTKDPQSRRCAKHDPRKSQVPMLAEISDRMKAIARGVPSER